MKYEFHHNNCVHVIEYKSSANKKLGMLTRLVGTYHYSLDQVLNNNFKLDSSNCLDCPFSYNQGKPQCYTHKSYMRLGLLAKLKSLHNRFVTIKAFDQDKFDEFFSKLSGVELVRFGVYGEPVLLPDGVIPKLSTLANSTGYTHQWNKDINHKHSKYLMASTHSAIEAAVANDLGWRVFNEGELEGAVNCPASKEQMRKSTCTQCSLCGGTSGNSKKNISILKH